MTAFLRSNRGVDSDVHDTFTIILQYSGEQKNLVVTIKTAIVTLEGEWCRVPSYCRPTYVDGWH